MFPGSSAANPSFWMGHRPSLPDSLPVIGPAPQSSSVLYAFGHGHLGLTGGAVTGQIIADLVAERRPGIDIDPFRIDRF
jgi:D-amino-acid dehydrogenase